MGKSGASMVELSALESVLCQLKNATELTDRWLSENAIARAMGITIQELKKVVEKRSYFGLIDTNGAINETGEGHTRKETLCILEGSATYTEHTI